jgi:hypothetical protein
MFQGGGGGGSQSKMIGMAMSEASKLFDQQSSRASTTVFAFYLKLTRSYRAILLVEPISNRS